MGKSKSPSNTPFLDSLQLLAAWFHRKKRILPWRDDPTVYRVWISEIMLQQTQVSAVIPYFERFMSRFPSVEVLANASLDDVLLQWAGLGYYSRARNLHCAAKQVAAACGFPSSREDWLRVPGVGNYTAGAILSISMDLPEPILDGNVERVLSRVRRVDRQKGDLFYKQKLWKISRAFVEQANRHNIRPSVLNQALMELGALVCVPGEPKCRICPLTRICRASQRGDQAVFPPRKAKKSWITVREELHCVLDRNGSVLLRQRRAGEWRAGLWDLMDQAPRDGSRLLGKVETRHVVTRHKITRKTLIWQTDESSQWRVAEEEQGLRWVSPGNPDVALGSALKLTLKTIREKFPEASRRS